MPKHIHPYGPGTVPDAGGRTGQLLVVGDRREHQTGRRTGEAILPWGPVQAWGRVTARLKATLLALCTALWMCAPAQAATVTWNGLGTTDNWSDTGNWGGATVQAGDDLVFAGTTRLTPNNNLGADISVNSITFQNGAGAFTIGGGRITLAGNITNNDDSLQTIDLAMILSGSTTVNTASTGGMTLGGILSGTGGITKSGAQTVTLGGANTYSGGTTLDGGTLAITTANATAGKLTFGAAAESTHVSTLDLSAASFTATSLFVQTNSVSTNTITIGNAKTLTLTGSTVANVMTVGGLTTAGVTTKLTVSGAGSFVVNDPTRNFVVAHGLYPGTGNDMTATLDMSGLSSFTSTIAYLYVGRSTDTAGSSVKGRPNDTLILGASNTITAGGALVVGATNGYSTSTTALKLGTANTINASAIVVGNGRTSATVQFNTGLTNPSVTIRGKTGGVSRATIWLGDGGDLTSVGSGPAVSSNSTGTLGFTTGTSGTVDAMIGSLFVGFGGSDSGPGLGVGDGVFTFAGASSTVDINTLVIGQTTVDTNNRTSKVTSTGTFTMNNGSLTVNTACTLANDTDTVTGTYVQHVQGTLTVAGGSATITPDIVMGNHTSTGTGAATAAINVTGGTLHCGGNIIKGTAGSGTLVTSITINGASTTLNMAGHDIGSGSGASAIDTFTFTNGILKDVGTGYGPIAIGTAATCNQANNAGEIRGIISGNGTLTKTGTDALTLSGVNNYAGGSTVSQGTFRLADASAAGTATITLCDAGTGTGNVQLDFNVGSGALANPITVANLGTGTVTINQGDAYSHLDGTLTLDRATTISGGGADRAGVSGKITRLEGLRSRLVRLDADEALPDAALRKACEADLVAWAAEVGGDDADHLRWNGRLQAAQEEITRLRGLLGELDRSDPVTVALGRRLAPPLQRLTVLASADDGERLRWQGLLDGQARRLAAARGALAELATAHPIPEARLKILRGEWRIFRAMSGDDDRDAATWGRLLDQREAAVQRLRDTGARLDRVDLATTTLQAEVAGDLERLAALVPADDPQLTAWRAKIALSSRRIEALRQGLGAVLDALGHPDAGTMASCQRQLAEYRALVSADDGHLAAWERRLVAEHQDVQDLTATLARLDQDAPLTLAEQAACRRASEELARRGLLGGDRHATAGRRLAVEAARIAELRALLAQAGRPDGGITPAVVLAVAALATATASDDAEVRRWQARIAEHQRLRATLAALDRLAPLAAEVPALLAAYADLVPADDADLRRWQAKTARIAALQRQLEPLRRAEAPPAGARAGLDELAERLTGPEDALVVAGRAKLARLEELQGTLAVLDHALVLPADRDLDAALGAWADLVGTGDGRWRAWSLRHRQLAGPGRPSWATLHGRDAHGPWAELVVNGSIQRLRFIPGGTMRLGSPSDEAGRDADEAPPHEQTVGSFWLADSECTQGLYAALLFAWPSSHRVPDRPVECVTRADALRFCAALSRTVAGAEARLPGEDEWEYACRAGADGPFCGPAGNLPPTRLGEVAWFGRGDAPRPVRLLRPNRFGLHDCHGNVWEWVADRYLAGDGRASGDDGVVRGGSWADRAPLLRAANRMALDPERRSTMVGFRVAISVRWPDGREPGTLAEETSSR